MKNQNNQRVSTDHRKESSILDTLPMMDIPPPSVIEKFTAGTNNGYQRQKVKLQLKIPKNFRVNYSRNKTQ